MKKNLIILIFIMGAVSAFTQKQGKSKIDSLFSVLKTAKQDTSKVNTLNALANKFRENNPDTAIYFANEARTLAIKLNYKMGIANALLTLGMTKTNLGKYAEALKNIRDALTIYDQLLQMTIGKDKTGAKVKFLKKKALTINNIGIIEMDQGNFPDALKNYFTSLKIWQEIGNKQGAAASYGNIAIVYNIQGNHPQALKNILEALKIFEETGDKYSIALTYLNIGNVYEQEGNYPKALNHYFVSLKLAEENGARQAIANARNSIGNIYMVQTNYPEALKNFSAALKIYEEIGHKQGIANCYSNVGIILSEQGHRTEAMKNFLSALKIREETGNQQGIAISYDNIGNNYRNLGNYPEALKNSFAALNISEKIGNPEIIASSYNNLGMIYTKQKKTKEASQFFNKGLSVAKESGNLEGIYEIYNGLAELDSAEGNFNQSLAHYKLAITTRDSMFNKENTKKLVQFQMQYDFDKKQLSDSLANEKDKLQREVTFKETLHKKNTQRNIFLFTGLAILALAGGLWSRLRYINRTTAIIQKEKKRSEDLLLNILPYEVAEELKQTGHCQAKTFSMVTVMFTDFKDFTNVSEKVSAELLVDEINFCFSVFDRILQEHKVEKIKTVGDAYICASGLPVLNYTHAFDLVSAAIEIRNFMLTRKKEKEAKGEIPFELRIGIHTGPVVAGIVGVKKFQYDIWGDTVNLAARMESSGEAGQVNISGTTYALVKDKFHCTHRGKIEAKHKGEIDMYFVESIS